MKKLYLLTTRLAALWVLLPLSFLLTLSITHNSAEAGTFGLYPLIILNIGAIIFSLIYFFRVIKISYTEIKHIGYFSTRDRSEINEGKTLILERLGRGKVKIILFGNDGVLPGLDWMKSAYSAPKDIVLFRGYARYGSFTVKRILSFFGAKNFDISALLEGDCTCEGEFTTITSITEDETRRIKIRINKTV